MKKEKIDGSKYIGTYTLEQLEELSKEIDKDIASIRKPEKKMYTIKQKVVVENTVTLKVFMGWRLRQIRESKSLTQDELSQKLGLSRASVVNIEQGKQEISLKNLEKICKMFNIKSSEILPF